MLISSAAAADDAVRASFAGRPVGDVIDGFRAEGYPFAYSTTLVTPELVVQAEPTPGDAVDIVVQILAPHGLTVRTEAGVHLVIPMPLESEDAIAEEVADASTEPPTIDNLIVSASRYAISRDIGTSRFALDQRSIHNMPDIGEDPIRVTHRLPGAAASGASAIAHFRGGEKGEIGIMLNGQWLFDPFHIRDFQNVFSAVDARAIDGVEVFTGGFPVRYGDRMSGMVLMDSLATDDSRHSEIGISVFNTSFLTTGTEGKSKWLFSARRGNLDLVIDPRFGEPSYFDVFGEFAYALSPRATISLNGLYADDTVDLVLEAEPTERDQISSDTRNAQFWLRLDNHWSEALSSTTVLSATNYANRRTGFANDREKMVASVVDHREVRQIGFRQDWRWNASDSHLTQWGITVVSGDAEFNYAGDAEYFGLQALYENQPPVVLRRVTANPKGGSYALYFSDRWKLSDQAILEWGLRWDDQTYTDVSSDAQLSPRINVLYHPTDKVEFRFSAGRYFQSGGTAH
ncbi:MAG: TonB-dependent receptor [Pseudomonadota bacterium]